MVSRGALVDNLAGLVGSLEAKGVRLVERGGVHGFNRSILVPERRVFIRELPPFTLVWPHHRVFQATDHDPLLDNVEVGVVGGVLCEADVVQVGEHRVSPVLRVVDLGRVTEHVCLEQNILDQLVVPG